MSLREFKADAMVLLKGIGSPAYNRCMDTINIRNYSIRKILSILLNMSNSLIILIRDRGLIIHVIQELMHLVITNKWQLNKFRENGAVANFSKLAGYTFKSVDPEDGLAETSQKQDVLRLITVLDDTMTEFASL